MIRCSWIAHGYDSRPLATFVIQLPPLIRPVSKTIQVRHA